MIEADLNTLIAAITAAILALIGYLNVKRTEQNSTIANATMQTAQSNAQLVSIAPAPAPAVYTGIDSRLRDSNGNLIGNQTNCSQFWMNAGYDGPEPSLATKMAFSDAAYAYANAKAIAANMVKQYGQDAVDPAILYLAKN